ncbi:site-specific integrase [uncultured Akkermansia sp.]|uniref:tyrosine-type recombinase/integrase n=1 Tax=uncultured Akkermansia sp. TaxID=512294 RepID=UPI0025F6D14D|nr:site-specific integrase [uncultured Akkermansia sp.]
MAYLRRRSGSKYWFAQWNDPVSGKKITRSTKVEAKGGNRRKAQDIADEFEEETKKVRTEIQVRKVLNDLHTRITGNNVVVKSVREVFEEWINNQSGGISRNSLLAYRGSIKAFLSWFGERSDQEINLVTQKDIVDFRNTTEKQRSGATVNKHLKLLRRIFADAKKKAYISIDPTDDVNIVKRRRQESGRQAFSAEELQRIVDLADPEWKSMIRFALYTGGQRLGDIALLKWANIDLQEQVIHFQTKKTGRQIVIPIIPSLLKHINSLTPPESSNTFVHPRAAASFEAQGSPRLSSEFGKILYRAGLRDTHPQASRKASDPNYKSGRREASVLSFHSLRATAATMLHAANVPPAMVQDIVGHDSAEVHSRYVKLGRDNVRNALGNLPEL